jgi:hypothetical protein
MCIEWLNLQIIAHPALPRNAANAVLVDSAYQFAYIIPKQQAGES